MASLAFDAVPSEFAMQSFWRLLLAALNYDICPWVNRWVYWIKRPVASLGLAAVMAATCAVFGKPAAFVALGAVLLVVGLGYVWPSVAIRGLSATVNFRRRRVTEDEPALAIVTIVNRWPWPVWGIAIEEGFGSGESVALAHLAGSSSSVFEWEFTPRCRGEYPLQPPRLVTGFPFGLRQASRPVDVERKLLVWPRIIPLDTLLDAAETRPSDDVFSEHRSGDSGDMSGTRPFRAGDSLRRVHWAQTARTGRMIVCERQAPTQSAIRVVFDSDPRLHCGTGRGSTLEWSIRIAASVCVAYHRENAQVECCFGHETLAVPSGAQGQQQFLDALARWQACRQRHAADCSHEHTWDQCRRIHHRNCGVFQLTITTDVGVGQRTEHRHVHGEQRMIVLQTAAFDESPAVRQNVQPPPNRLAVILDRAENVPDDFRRKWRHVCHAG